MTLSNLTALSLFTDKAPASPAYFNAKFAEVQANFESIASGALSGSGASDAISRQGGIVFADQMSGSDWGQKVAAAYSLATYGTIVDASGLTGKQAMSSTLTIDVPYTTLRWSSTLSLNMGTSSIVVPAATHGVTLAEADEGTGWGSRAKNGAYPQGMFDYRGTGTALVVGSDQTATLNFTLKNFGLWLGGSNASAQGISLRQVLYFDLVKPMVLGRTGSTHSNIGITIDGTDTNNSLFAGWGTIYQPVLNRMWRGIVGTGTEPYSANAITVIGGSMQGMGSGVSGTRGLLVDKGRGWFVQGLDIDNFEHGVHLDTGNHAVVFRGENNTTDIYLSSTASLNYVNCVRDGSSPTNLGSSNFVLQAGTYRGNFLADGTTHTFGAAGSASQTLVLKAAAATTRNIAFASGNNGRWRLITENTAESGSDAGSNFQIGAYTDSDVLIDYPLSITRASGGSILLARPLNLGQNRLVSMRTLALTSLTSANLAQFEVALGYGASGCSLAFRSGGTVWYPNSSLSTVG